MNKTTKMLPTIHMNGTHPDDLLEAISNAGNAAMEAAEKLTAAWPNGRDYYPQGPDAYKLASEEYEEQRAKLVSECHLSLRGSRKTIMLEQAQAILRFMEKL